MAEYPEGYRHTDKDGRTFVKQSGEWIEMTARPTAAPAVAAEYAGGVNRSMSRIGDFFGPGSLNTAVEQIGRIAPHVSQAFGEVTEPLRALTGQQGQGLPTFEQGMEDITGGTSGFMEPGLARDVTQAAGEWTPAFANPDLIRQTGRGVQQLARSRNVNRMLERAAPEVDDLETIKRATYKQFEGMNQPLSQNETVALADDIYGKMRKAGMHPKSSPAMQGVIDDFVEEAKGPMTIADLERWRKIAGGETTSPKGIERSLAGIMRRSIDDHYLRLGDDIANTAKRARLFNQQWEKGKELEKVISLAQTRGSGFENALRNEFANLERKIIRETKGNVKTATRFGKSGWSKEEMDMIGQVSRGGKVGNVLKWIGKMGPMEGRASRSLVPGLSFFGPTAIGAITGNPIVGATIGGVTMGVGQAARMTASKLTQQNARLAAALTRSGPNGRAIASAYMRTTPKAQQSANELASLFYVGQIPRPALDVLEKGNNAMVANAAAFAALIQEQAEQEMTQQQADKVPGNAPQ